jgi:hypothetical protein
LVDEVGLKLVQVGMADECSRAMLKTKFPSFLPLFDLMYDSPSCHRVLSKDGDVVDLVCVIQGPGSINVLLCYAPWRSYQISITGETP